MGEGLGQEGAVGPSGENRLVKIFVKLCDPQSGLEFGRTEAVPGTDEFEPALMYFSRVESFRISYFLLSVD